MADPDSSCLEGCAVLIIFPIIAGVVIVAVVGVFNYIIIPIVEKL